MSVFEDWVIWVFLGAQIFDAWSTNYALKRGAREANPLVVWMIDRFGRGWVLIKVALSVGIMALAAYLGAREAIVLMTALVFWVGLRNVMIARDL